MTGEKRIVPADNILVLEDIETQLTSLHETAVNHELTLLSYFLDMALMEVKDNIDHAG